MKRKITLELEVDWNDYDDVCDELLVEDVFEDYVEKLGTSIKIVNIEEQFIGFANWLEKKVGNFDIYEENGDGRYIKLSNLDLYKSFKIEQYGN